ncbi:MAG: FHA domain-containing protein [Acidobacteria bacterium]|nr:FHA domain-containing protein [Acidobacteriota bacterium]
MTDKTPVSKKGLSADWLLQGALTRIGDTVDKFTGRRWTPSSSLATSELVERMKKLLDSEVKGVLGKGSIVPHNITLKVHWDKFATDADDTLLKLENELLTAAADHINDKLYYTFAPLSVEVKPDYFTEGVKLFVSFDKFSDEDHEAELNVTIPSIKLGDAKPHAELIEKEREGAVFVAHFELNGTPRDRRITFPSNGRLSVGRTVSNDLTIDDVSVSKIHASLVIDSDDNLSVADTGSTNGTFVNGERIPYGKALRLKAEDRVKFGMVDVVFEKIPSESGNTSELSQRFSQENTIEIDGLKFTGKVSAEAKIAAQDPPEKNGRDRSDENVHRSGPREDTK